MTLLVYIYIIFYNIFLLYLYIYIHTLCASEELAELFPRFRLDVTFRGSRFGDDYAESGCLGDHCD